MMTFLFGKVVFIKVHRILKLFCLIFLFIILATIYLRRSSRLTNYIQLNGNIFQQRILESENDLQKNIIGQPDLPKYIHLDLKGAPPKADKFYESFFDFIEKIQMGVKGILIEYEDTLPLEGNLTNATHRFGYTKSDIKLIEESAKKHKLELIPLIQTFGHLEWILKLDEFKSYRDNENLPNVISPCIDATYILLEDLLRQTLDMHPNSNIIHIGCDEVTLSNSHPQCATTSFTLYERYIKHIARVASIVHKIRPGIRILIWDDILRSEESIRNQNAINSLKDLVEPVSWNYFQKFEEQYQLSSAWKIYPKLFKNMWSASAFKGGLHRFSMITNTTHHVLNNLQWLQFMQSSTFPNNSFSGIILTGWSRFDHFMPLCDLLPTAYSSLLYSLHVLNTNKLFLNNEIRDCEYVLESIGKDTGLCEILPGRSIWRTILSLSPILSRIQTRLKLLHTIAPSYNLKYSFIRRHELDSFLSGLELFQRDLSMLKYHVNNSLTDLYTEDVITEWFDLYLTPIEIEINTTIKEFTPGLTKITWPRRPLH